LGPFGKAEAVLKDEKSSAVEAITAAIPKKWFGDIIFPVSGVDDFDPLAGVAISL
jgi:hypothetical protein